MLTNIIANAYLTPTRSIQIPSTPGKPVKFQGGHARLVDERDVVNMLRRPDITLDFTDEWAERLPTWIEQAGGAEKIQATITTPRFEMGCSHPVKRKRGRPLKASHQTVPAEESWSDLLQDESD